MTTPFERFNMKHLSPSSLNMYAVNPCLWVGKYLFGWKDDMGPAAFRGTAIEAGLDHWLYQRHPDNALTVALNQFARLTEGEASDEHEAERANIEPMLQQAIAALKEYPVPVARQIKAEHWVDGVEVPIIGYIDYLFDDHGLDLKTTKACPSSIKADHGRQVALYSKAKERPFSLLYVTAKKSAIYPLSQEDADMHLRDLERQARAVRHLLAKSETPRDAANYFAPDFSDFRWSEKTIESANQLYLAA